LDPDDLEAIAIIYDKIRQARRSNEKIQNNNDKKMASDFDAHLKKVMGNLTNDITKQGLNKNVAVLKAKKALIEILEVKS
jgi:hypothetical protein